MCACLTHRKRYSNRYKQTDVRKEKRNERRIEFLLLYDDVDAAGELNAVRFIFIVRFPLPKLLRVGCVVSIKTTWKRDRKRRKKRGGYYYTILYTQVYRRMYLQLQQRYGVMAGQLVTTGLTSLSSNAPWVSSVKKNNNNIRKTNTIIMRLFWVLTIWKGSDGLPSSIWDLLKIFLDHYYMRQQERISYTVICLLNRENLSW